MLEKFTQHFSHGSHGSRSGQASYSVPPAYGSMVVILVVRDQLSLSIHISIEVVLSVKI